MKALNGSLVSSVNIIDQIHIDPDVDALDFSNAGPIFKDSASITDFSLTVSGDTIAFAGTAASHDQQNTVDHDAKHIWSNLNVVDNLAVNGPVPPPAPPAPPTSPVPPYAPYGPGSARATPDGGGGLASEGPYGYQALLHPDDATYDKTVAQVWLKDEKSAVRALFTPWRRSSRKG
jgi:hypothetical protein